MSISGRYPLWKLSYRSVPCIAPPRPPHDPPPDRHVLATRQTLDLTYCSALTSLPAELGRLTSLRTLTLSGCEALTSLPAELANLTSLRTLELSYCDALTGMPDLSGLPQLQARRTMMMMTGGVGRR